MPHEIDLPTDFRAGAPAVDPSTNGDLPDEPGYVVLDDLLGWLLDHVAYASPHHPVAVVLWVAHTHAHSRAASTPRLAFTSPEPESGKTRNLELLELVVRQGRLVLQMSASSVYRWVDAFHPTILLDELDAVSARKHPRIMRTCERSSTLATVLAPPSHESKPRR